MLAAAVGTYLAVIVGRSLQGFAAALIPIGISIMRDELPKEKVGSAVALMSATLGIGAALGLPLSGLIFENLGWQAIFWISAGIGAALIIGVLSLVSESTVRTRGRFDYLGALMLSVALTALLLGISKGGSWGWGSQRVVGLFLTTAVVLALWVPYELKIGHPLVDLRTSARRPVLLTNIASILAGFAMFANLLLTTQQLQLPQSTGYGFGLPVITAGLAMVPSGLAMVLFAPVSGRMINRYGGRITLIAGAAIMGVAYIGRVLLLRHRGRRDHRFDRGRHRDRNRVRRDADADHGVGADHRDRHRERAQCLAAGGRHVIVERGGGGRARVGDDAGRGGRRCRPSRRSRTSTGWPASGRWRRCAVAWYIPAARRARRRRRAGRDVGPRRHPAGESRELVVHGTDLQSDRTPAHPAVVTVVKIDGTPVDWGRGGQRRQVLGGAARAGQVPGAGQRAGLGAACRGVGVRRRDLSAASDPDRPTDAVRNGELRGAAGPAGTGDGQRGERRGVRSVRADEAGRYCMPLPPVGRYIVTMLEPTTLQAHARKLVLDVRSEVVDIDAPAAVVAKPAGR